MSSNHVENIHNTSAAGNSNSAANTNLTENIPVDPNAPYKHAPPKDGDPWVTLLAPELEADAMRCKAWTEEVQNLLIFAGLFSAVVTAFVIESYKFLSPDPNDAVIGLLFHIANGLNNTSPFPPSINPEAIFTPFTQTASTIRINIFWFISLVLSLTTVLVGTIALQWLREHQSYIGYSGKEKLAILHMRKEAAEAWYLPQVFAALPLLLQAALILFLAGLIDFSIPLGLKVTIPVSIVIGLTLLFLAATTILPSLQGLSFFWGLHPQDTLPTPCPFKSPQSLAFHALYGVALRAFFRVFPPPSVVFESNAKSESLRWIVKNSALLMPDHLAPSAYDLWMPQTWLTSDREWLSLRDACHQRMVDDDPDLYHHRLRWKRSFPLSDITQCLVKAVSQTRGIKHTESYLVALVHCFQELADSIWSPQQILQLGSDIQRKDRRNHYFEQLHCKPSCSMSKFFLHGGDYKFERFGTRDYALCNYMEPRITRRLFCDDQTMTFLRILLENHRSPALSQYQLELWSRVLQTSSHVAPFTSNSTEGVAVLIPTIIEYPLIYSMIPDDLSDQRISTIFNILSTLLNLAASHRISQDQSMNSLCAHPHMVDVLNSLAYLTTLYLRPASKDTISQQNILRDVDHEFFVIFDFITRNLNAKLPSSSTLEEPTFEVFFYLSSIFIWGLLHWLPDEKILKNRESGFGQALKPLLDVLYNARSSGRSNVLIEARFQGYLGGYERFSEDWWRRLFASVVSAPTKETPTLGALLEANSDTCFQQLKIDNSSSSRHFDANSSGPDIAQSTRAEDNNLQSHSDCGSILYTPLTPVERQGSLTRSQLPLSRSISAAMGIVPADGDLTIDVAPSSISQPLPPPDITDPVNIMTEAVIMDVPSPSDAVIDIGSPTADTVRVDDVAVVAVSSNDDQNDPELIVIPMK